MEMYVIKVEWRYEEDEQIVGVCDKDHIESMQLEYQERYKHIKDSIRHFSVEPYTLNQC